MTNIRGRGQKERLVAVLEVIRMWFGLIRTLELGGLVFSFFGTALMIYGALDAFIKIVPRAESNEDAEASIGNEKIELDFKKLDNPKRRLIANKIGIFLLMFGFLLQLIAMILDWWQFWK